VQQQQVRLRPRGPHVVVAPRRIRGDSLGIEGAACKATTGLRHVWTVQYVNGMGSVIRDTLEVGGVPAAVRDASPARKFAGVSGAG